MLLTNAIATLAALATLSSAENQSLSSNIIPIDEYPNDVLNATAWSIIYSYPLDVFSNWVAPVLNNASVNTIVHQRSLATAEASGILKPNVDTIYSRAVLDLSTQDVVLTVPNITNRYYVFPIYDPFGNAIVEIGSVFQNKSGKYIIRRADDVSTAPGYQEADSTLQSLGYQGIVNLPTTYATMLIRILVLQNTTEELATIRKYQDESGLESIPRDDSINAKFPAPALNATAINGSFLGINSLSELLEFATRLIPYNQPEIFSERYRVASILSQAGLYNGHYHAPNVNLTRAGAIANASMSYNVVQPYAMHDQGNNWTIQTPPYQGNYGTHYAANAYVALGGYQQQTAAQALYPTIKGQGWSVAFDLQPNTSVLFSFSGKPRLKKLGFWSLTIYGENSYLVPNPINRFEVGDRTYNLTYEGSEDRIYGPNADAERDGKFQVLLQPVDLPPPANWTSNWLPVEDKFSIILRWYVPDEAMIDGTYVYPEVKTIPAIV